MKTCHALIGALVLSMSIATPALANGSGDWVLRFGAHTVNPKSDNGQLAGMKASIDSDTRPTVSLEYMVTPAWGVEVLAAVPFKHEIKLDGQKAASTRQLPPVIGVNYHFLPDARVSPFLGAGINYTRFFDARGEGLLQGAKVKIDSSWGAAAHAGVDITLAPRWSLTADVRWIDIESDVHVNDAKVGRAKVSPLAYGLSFGYRF